MERVTIMGIPFINATQAEFVNQLDKHLTNEDKVFVVTANPEIVMKANEEADYGNILKQATYITPDGIGIVKAAQLLNKHIPERVTGYDTMVALLELAEQKQYKIYMLGGTQETIEKAEKNIRATYPNIQIVGSHNGYFDWNSNDIQADIQGKQPDLIFVALGVPRQEKWIAENLPKLSKGVCIGVGGSFDVIAGTVERAPEAWQKANLEWLYRLIKQPSRWRRMLALPRFAIKIMKMKVTRNYE